MTHELTVWEKFDFPRINGCVCGAYYNRHALTGQYIFSVGMEIVALVLKSF